MPAPTQAAPVEETSNGSRPAGPVARRLVYAIALIPMVPAAAILLAERCETYFGSNAVDNLRWFHLWMSLLAVAGAVCIWRTVILWTLGRRWLTALVGLIPFV